jgi:hypothetical protein
MIFMTFSGIDVDEYTADKQKDREIKVPKDKNVFSIDIQEWIVVSEVDIEKE